MPFQSEKQRRYLWANEPKIARDWADTYGSRIEKNDGGISQLVKSGPGRPGYGGPHETELAGSSYRAAKADPRPGGGAGNWQKQALQQHKQQQGLKEEVRRHQEEKREEKVERFRNKKRKDIKTPFASVNLLGNFLNKGQGKNRNFFLDKVLSANKWAGFQNGDFYNLNPSEQEAMYQQYMTQRMAGGIDAYGNPTGGGGGGSYYPRDVHPGTGVTDITEVIEEETPSRNFEMGGELQYKDYGTRAHGLRHNVDKRMFEANGGRIPAAFGGIMDSSTGRRAYGLGSIFKSIKKAAKKVFKSPVGKAALMYGAATGLGSFMPGGTGFGKNMFSPSNLGALFMRNKPTAAWLKKEGFAGLTPDALKQFKGQSWFQKLNPVTTIGALGTLPFFMGGEEEDEGSKFDYEAAKNKYRDELMRIKSGAMAGSLDPNEFNYLGVKDGGRIGLYAGGQSTPSDYTMEDAMMTTTQDKLGGITDVMKQADLNRQGSVGQFYAAHGGSADAKLMARIKELQDEGLDYNSARAQAEKEAQGKAQGGRIGYGGGTDLRNKMSKLLIKLANGTITDEEIIELRNIESASGFSTAQGKAEGGLMDLGGMEKDYRNDGGFVPLGGEEKADDVPARLSKNEFVFTADAVRGAGDGDIDKGAEIMENIMKNLEQGGQISEETQGLSGAQEMFGVSERLSEVV